MARPRKQASFTTEVERTIVEVYHRGTFIDNKAPASPQLFTYTEAPGEGYTWGATSYAWQPREVF